MNEIDNKESLFRRVLKVIDSFFNDDTTYYAASLSFFTIFSILPIIALLIAIISNSIDALKNKNNPKIRINIFSNNAEVIISLEDNASGIKPKNLKKIFEPYFSTKEEGTGIGLYLSKMIIEESFSGKILVENQKEGVLFSLFIEKTF